MRQIQNTSFAFFECILEKIVGYLHRISLDFAHVRLPRVLTSFTLNNLHAIDFVLKRDGFSRHGLQGFV